MVETVLQSFVLKGLTMPRIRAEAPTDRIAPFRDLVSKLATELRHNSHTGQPVIVERKAGTAGAQHVFVFWDEWSRVPPSLRGAVILAAYEQADPEMVNQITLAMGVTMEQALSMNLLPYAVTPMLRNTDKLKPDEAIRLMQREGAFKTSDDLWHLCFPTMDLAEAARKKLADASSPDYWAITVVAIPPLPNAFE